MHSYAYVAYFCYVATLFIFKSSVVKICLFSHYDAMLLHHCAYVRVHSCCLYFFHSIQREAVAPRCVCKCWFVELWLLFYPLHCNAPLCIWKYWFVRFSFYCPVFSLTLMQCSSTLCVCESSVVLLPFFSFSFQCITHIDHWFYYISLKLCVC